MLGSLESLSTLGAVPNLVTMRIHLLNLGVYDVPLGIARNGQLAMCLVDYPNELPESIDEWPETDTDASLPPGCVSPVEAQQLDDAVKQLFEHAAMA